MRTLNSFHLKLIAITAMLINHIGHVFEHEYASPAWNATYLTIGKLTFPIMAYLLVEGFFHTKNHWKYISRLALFWLIALLPFHLAFMPSFFSPFNNIMFTLMMGVLLMMACERVKQPVWQGLLCLLFLALTITSDWSLVGIVFIFSFYKLHGQAKKTAVFLLIATLAMTTLSALLILSDRGWEPVVEALSCLGLAGVIPLLKRYNGQRGYSPVWVKWGFYAFYPLHLACLLGLRILLFGY